MTSLRPFAARVAAFVVALAAWPASAATYFQINELYTNASGTVQYVELRAQAAGQQALAGHSFVISLGGQTRVCAASGNLPGDSYGHKVLFGTAGVEAALHVKPDFICDNNFLYLDGAVINWDQNSDVVAYNTIPTNGQSLNRVGNALTAGPATPENYASATSTPVPGPAYQGMWWASPAGSESGWGVNTAHQGDTIFATWFTYGLDGTGQWFILPDARKTGEGVYSGAIYTTRGPPYYAQPFDSSQVTTTQVGTGTFTFTSTTKGVFAYTVNGTSQTKQIERFEFATSVPTCTVGGAPGGTGINYQDLWWNSPGGSESGWGLNVVHQGDQMFLTWFTYDASGKGQWLVMPDVTRSGPEIFNGTIYRTTGNSFASSPWNAASVVYTPVGNVTLSFSNRSSGTFTYTLDGISQSKAITRIVFDNTSVTTCNNP